MVLFLLNANLSVGITGGLSLNNKVFGKVDNKWEAIDGLVDTTAVVTVAEAKLTAFEDVPGNMVGADGERVPTQVAAAEHAKLAAALDSAREGKQTFFGSKSIVAEGNVGYKFHMGSLFIKPEGVIGMNFANEQKGAAGVVSSSYYGQVNVKPGYSMGALDVYGIVGFRMTQSNVVLGDNDFQNQADHEGYVFSGMPMTLTFGGGVSYAVASNVAVTVDATYGMGLTSKELSEQAYDNNNVLQPAAANADKETISLGGDVRVVGGVNYSF
jgi:opacity protein-like surface antigen